LSLRADGVPQPSWRATRTLPAVASHRGPCRVAPGGRSGVGIRLRRGVVRPRCDPVEDSSILSSARRVTPCTCRLGSRETKLGLTCHDRHPDGSPRTILATLEGPSLSASVPAYDDNYGALADFFDGLAASWRGRDGERAFGSLEGDLDLVATHDGHVRLTVRLRVVDGPGDWDVRATSRSTLARTSRPPPQMCVQWSRDRTARNALSCRCPCAVLRTSDRRSGQEHQPVLTALPATVTLGGADEGSTGHVWHERPQPESRRRLSQAVVRTVDLFADATRSSKRLGVALTRP
jgi:hypothetical protein